MAPRIPRNLRRPKSSKASSREGNQQQGVTHNLSRNPFPYREEDEGYLYNLPLYRFPHTLTFLDNFSPEDEARMIAEFRKAEGNIGRVPLPLATSFQSSFRAEDEKINETGGWGKLGKDL